MEITKDCGILSQQIIHHFCVLMEMTLHEQTTIGPLIVGYLLAQIAVQPLSIKQKTPIEAC